MQVRNGDQVSHGAATYTVARKATANGGTLESKTHNGRIRGSVPNSRRHVYQGQLRRGALGGGGVEQESSSFSVEKKTGYLGRLEVF